MPTSDFARRGLSNEQDRAIATIGRIGNMAAVVTAAVLIFAALYYVVLYLGTQ
jgi:hypothetical protein